MNNFIIRLYVPRAYISSTLVVLSSLRFCLAGRNKSPREDLLFYDFGGGGGIRRGIHRVENIDRSIYMVVASAGCV